MTITVGTYQASGASGWTSGTLPAGDKIAYVSSSGGHDGNNGLSSVPNPTNTGGAGAAGPKKTLAAGVNLLTNGSGDWLLLRVGDTWTDEALSTSGSVSGSFFKRGRSSSEPIVVSSYDPATPTVFNPGTGARPQLKNSYAAGVTTIVIGTQNQTPYGNIAIIGLDFYAYTRDTTNPSYNATDAAQGGSAIGVIPPGEPTNYDPGWNLVEDCLIRYHQTGLTIQWASPVSGFSAPNVGTLILRRNVIHHFFQANPPPFNPASNSPRPGGGLGMFIWNVLSSTIEENVFDWGWDPNISTSFRDAYDHNIYYNANDNSTPGVISIRGNIFTRASAFGLKAWAGGTIKDNFFAYCGGGIQMCSGSCSSAVNLVQNCVVQKSMGWDGNATAGGWGQGFAAGNAQWGIEAQGGTVNPITIDHCIAAHAYGSSGNNNYMALTLGSQVSDSPNGNATISNCIAYDWPAQSGTSANILDWKGNNTLTNNQSETGSSNSHGYPDPTRSIESYTTSLGLGSTLDNFMTAAYAQSKASWNLALTAPAINNNIRAGFNAGTAVAPALLALRLRLHG